MTKMNNIISEILNNCYMLDRSKKALQARFYYQLMAKKPKHDRLYCRFFLWLGTKLVSLGARLQQRYDQVEAVKNIDMLVAGENSN